TQILTTVDGVLRTLTESSLRRNLKLQDEEGVSSLPDTDLFENLTLMGYNISPNQKFTFQKEAQPSSHIHISLPFIPTVTSVPTIPIPTVIPYETTPIRQYTRRARIAQSSALPPVVDEPASLVKDISQWEACPTDSGFIADQDRATIAKSSTLPHDSAPRVTSPAAEEGSMQQLINELTALCTSLQRQHSELLAKFQAQEVEINRLKERVKILEDKGGVIGDRSGDDAPIKGRSMDDGEATTKRVSNDTEEMETGLTSMDAATILASGVVDVPTSSGSIPTASTPAEGSIPTSSEEVTTASLVFATAIVRRVQQIARDAEIARIHAKEELQSMIDGLDSNNKTVAKYLDEYRINLEQESTKKHKSSQEITEEAKSHEEVTEAKIKEMMQLVPIEEVYVKALQVKHPIIDWEVHTEGQRAYWKITRLGGSSKLSGRIVGNKMHKEFPLPAIKFLLLEQLPTASEVGSHCQKDRTAINVKKKLPVKDGSYANVLISLEDPDHSFQHFVSLMKKAHLFCGISNKCMRTRNSYFPNNSSATISRRRNKRRTPNVVELEVYTIIEMADNRSMEELLQAPTKGYGEVIVIPEINVDHFEIKTNLLQLVQANPYHGFERENPHTHINNFKRISSTLKYRDVPNDSVPHHGFMKLAQIDTFYNGLNDNDQDSLNAAMGGNLLSKTTREALQIIENKSKVFYSRNKPNVSRMNMTSRENASKSDGRIDKLADQILTLVDIFVKKIVTPALGKAVEESCVTCGGRSFLRTGRGLIDIYREEITLWVNDEAVTFNLNQTTRYSSTYDDMSLNRIDVIDVAREEYAQEMLRFSNSSFGGNPTSTSEPIISDSSPSLTSFEGSDLILEEIKANLKDESILPKIHHADCDPEGDICLIEKLLNDDCYPDDTCYPIIQTPKPNNQSYKHEPNNKETTRDE
nr:reverse transcriptase domain-containing protein [Tanacetum cinerariifolium]